MAKEKKKTTSKTAEYWVKYVSDKFEEAKNFRSSRVEKQWLINAAYYKGYHNLKYDPTQKRLEFSKVDPLDFYVNQVYAIVRAVRSAITRNQPEWDVDARPYNSISSEDAELLDSFLDNLYEKLDMKYKVKEWVMYGLLYGLAPLQYGFDSDADYGEGELWVDVYDPFDVYIDPAATGIDDARYVVKVLRRPIDLLKKNKTYSNTDQLGEDNRAAASEYKEQLVYKTYSTYTNVPGTTLVYEAWIRDDEGIRVVTTAGNQLLREELTDFDTLPFILYQPDINPNEIYSEGWVKNLIPLNRALNYAEKNTLEYIRTTQKGRYVTENNSGIKSFNNENGTIYRKNRGAEFTQLPTYPLSNTPFNFVNNVRGYLEDVGSAHEAFMGRAPAGVTAAVAFEQLVANNMNNLADLIDNLEISYSELAEALLKLGYKYYDTSKEFKVKGQGGEIETVKVVGQNGREIPGAVKLPEHPQVKASIVAGIGYTKGGRQELLFQLRKGADVDRRTLLEQLGLDADLVENRLNEERQGLPVSEDGMSQEDMMEMQAGPGAPAPEAMEAPVPGASEQGPVLELPLRVTPDEFFAFLEQNSLTLSPEFEADPQLIVALIAGDLPYHIMPDGVIMPGATMG